MTILNLTIISLFIILSITIWFLAGKKWNQLSNFFHFRYSFIDISFILIYFFEQVLLTYFIYIGLNPQLVAGILSIIIITTASIQNKCWESRTQKINEKSIEQNSIINELQQSNQEILEDNRKLIDNLEKSERIIRKLYDELDKSKKS